MECRHIQNYLRHLKSKTDFERELLRRYDYFYGKGTAYNRILQRREKEEQYCERIRQAGCYYHGDYQYHNVIFDRNDICVINMERFGKDSGVKGSVSAVSARYQKGRLVTESWDEDDRSI